MSMAVVAVKLAVLSAVLFGPCSVYLARAKWPHREPRAVLILWQAVGLASGVALLGAAFTVSLASLDDRPTGAARAFFGNLFGGDLTGGLGFGHLALLVAATAASIYMVSVLALTVLRTLRARRRHRDLVHLVARPIGMPGASGSDGPAHVLDHPALAAYCLPGRVTGEQPRVIITSGALAALDDEELAAVMAHERAHLAERHDLVAMSFAGWLAALPWMPGVRRAKHSVAMLLEMLADDRASRVSDRMALASALARIGLATKRTPDGAMAADGGQVLTRVHRLLDPPNRSRALRVSTYLASTALVLAPPIIVLASQYY